MDENNDEKIDDIIEQILFFPMGTIYETDKFIESPSFYSDKKKESERLLVASLFKKELAKCHRDNQLKEHLNQKAKGKSIDELIEMADLSYFSIPSIEMIYGSLFYLRKAYELAPDNPKTSYAIAKFLINHLCCEEGLVYLMKAIDLDKAGKLNKDDVLLQLEQLGFSRVSELFKDKEKYVVQIEEIIKKLACQEELITKQKELIVVQDEMLENRQGLILNIDEFIKKQNEMLENLERIITTQEKMITSEQEMITKQKELMEDKNEVIKTQKELIEDKNEVITMQEKIIADQNKMIKVQEQIKELLEKELEYYQKSSLEKFKKFCKNIIVKGRKIVSSTEARIYMGVGVVALGVLSYMIYYYHKYPSGSTHPIHQEFALQEKIIKRVRSCVEDLKKKGEGLESQKDLTSLIEESSSWPVSVKRAASYTLYNEAYNLPHKFIQLKKILYEKSLGIYPDSDVAYELALIFEEFKDYESTEKYLKKAVSICKGDCSSYYHNLIHFLEKQKKYEDAIIFLKKLIEIEPTSDNKSKLNILDIMASSKKKQSTK